MSTPRPRALLGLAIVGLLAACSGSSPPSDEASSPSTPPTAAPREALVAYADHVTEHYDDPARWICRPDVDDDPCDGDLDATRVDADGTLTVEPFTAVEESEVDCFYVYPTVSADPTAISDWEPGPQEIGTTLMQAARVQSECRLFAPVYRQITTAGLAGRAEDPEVGTIPYGDVRDAFLTYLARDNDGRGIVLLGHSQGSLWLAKLLREVIETDPDLLALLVGAYLPGTDVRVPPGEVVGSSFAEVAVCTEAAEVGCVTTWAAWDVANVPADTANDDGARACVPPGTVAGAIDTLTPTFQTVLSSLIGPGPDGQGGGAWVDGADEEVATPYVALPDLVRAECSEGPTEGHLAVEVLADPSDPRTDELPLYTTRGGDLHQSELMLGQGEVVASIGRQIEAYLRALADG